MILHAPTVSSGFAILLMLLATPSANTLWWPPVIQVDGLIGITACDFARLPAGYAMERFKDISVEKQLLFLLLS